MVGILDAEPTSDSAALPAQNELEAGMAIFVDGFGHILETLGPLARQFLGRPADAYGITPLVIYREVTG